MKVFLATSAERLANVKMGYYTVKNANLTFVTLVEKKDGLKFQPLLKLLNEFQTK